MKNYYVKCIMKFKDLQNNDKIREINDTFWCTKERYEYLKDNNAVELIRIAEDKPKKNQSKKQKNEVLQ